MKHYIVGTFLIYIAQPMKNHLGQRGVNVCRGDRRGMGQFMVQKNKDCRLNECLEDVNKHQLALSLF